MITGYGQDAEIDLDALDEMFDATQAELLEKSSRPTRRLVLDRQQISLKPSDSAIALAAPLQSEHRTTTAGAALSVSMRRNLRTIAPLVAADLLALSLGGLIAQALIMALRLPGTSLGALSAIALWPMVMVYWFSHLYVEIWVHPVIEFRQTTRVTTAVLLSAAAGALAAPPLSLWFLLAIPAIAGISPILRTLARHCCVSCNWWGFPTLVIGSGECASDVAKMLLEVPRSGLRPTMLHDPDATCRAKFLPVVNDHNLLESIVRTEGIRHGVISLPDASPAKLAEALDKFGSLIPHLLVLSDSSTLPSLWGASRSCGRLSGFEVRNDSMFTTLHLLSRVIDVVLASIALFCGLPLLGAVAALARWTSPGPLFFGHTRIGLGGRRFKAWKFRTMHVNGDSMLQELLEKSPEARAEWDRDHKLRDDPRVTIFGKFLRKTSLDELPQLWNVLRGDMSLVGPRPIVEAEIERYGDVFKQYVSVKPGITGLWQASGRNDVGYADRVRLDQFYIRHWSPWLDVYIMAKTVVALLNRDGAY